MPNRVAGDLVEIYGYLNKHCPYIGYFHYSPAQSRNLNLFFADNVISTEEMERRKRIRNHPFTGNFHFAPGKYSDLHDLRRYRRVSAPRSDMKITDSSMDKFDAFCEKMSHKENEGDDSDYIILNGLSGNTSRDDSAILVKRCLPRCLSSESGLKFAPRYPTSLDRLDQTLSRYMLKARPYGSMHGEVYTDTDMSQASTRRSWRYQRLPETRGEAKNIVEPTLGPSPSDGGKEMDWRDRSGSHGNILDSSPRSRRHSPPPLSVSPPLSVRNLSSRDMSFSDKISGPTPALASAHSVSLTVPDEVPRIQLTEPKGSWQVHHDEGVSGFSYDQNRVQGRLRNRFVDKYRLHVDKIMGEGSYAKVVLATNKQSDTFVAVKIINKSDHNSKEEEVRFRNEIDNQSRLWHHNICSVLDVYESPNHIYIVLDYCPGGTLEQILELRRRLDEEETRFIAYQLFAGMAYMHENGVLHGKREGRGG